VGVYGMNSRRYRIRWFALSALTIGMLFQSGATTCGSLAAYAGSSLTTSIVNQVIENNVSQALGLGSTNTSLSSLTGLGT